ncbi:hypothetical protein C8R45DRAFT_935999 [Mycena sanguinolenta]|nr:hypothetical protein C8R45DRAFT_935999 [Mycena sanguinolenta]
MCSSGNSSEMNCSKRKSRFAKKGNAEFASSSAREFMNQPGTGAPNAQCASLCRNYRCSCGFELSLLGSHQCVTSTPSMSCESHCENTLTWIKHLTLPLPVSPIAESPPCLEASVEENSSVDIHPSVVTTIDNAPIPAQIELALPLWRQPDIVQVKRRDGTVQYAITTSSHHDGVASLATIIINELLPWDYMKQYRSEVEAAGGTDDGSSHTVLHHMVCLARVNVQETNSDVNHITGDATTTNVAPPLGQCIRETSFWWIRGNYQVLGRIIKQYPSITTQISLYFSQMVWKMKDKYNTPQQGSHSAVPPAVTAVRGQLMPERVGRWERTVRSHRLPTPKTPRENGAQARSVIPDAHKATAYSMFCPQIGTVEDDVPVFACHSGAACGANPKMDRGGHTICTTHHCAQLLPTLLSAVTSGLKDREMIYMHAYVHREKGSGYERLSQREMGGEEERCLALLWYIKTNQFS